jgi:Protein of unknown function (DUF3823) N-terminal domain/Domain of unknown function (DUF3823_C)
MKKTLYFLSLFTSLVLFATSCEIDNYPAPDAQVFGAIRDSTGGALVETDLNSGSQIGAYEQGYATPVLRNWVVKQSGEYRNNLVYSNTYNFVFQSCNFFPYTVTGEVIRPGANERDFLVVPYIRIKNPTITYDAVANKINATFSIEGGKPSVKVAKVSLYVFTDMYVGEYVKKSLTTGTGQPTLTLSGAAQTINPATVYTLSIDLAANASIFGIHRNYYFRVGALGIQTGVGTVRPNYAPYVVIAL